MIVPGLDASAWAPKLSAVSITVAANVGVEMRMVLTPVDPKEWDRVCGLHIRPSECRRIYVGWSALRCERSYVALLRRSSRSGDNTPSVVIQPTQRRVKPSALQSSLP